jgi:hypothetical protein
MHAEFWRGNLLESRCLENQGGRKTLRWIFEGCLEDFQFCETQSFVITDIICHFNSFYSLAHHSHNIHFNRSSHMCLSPSRCPLCRIVMKFHLCTLLFAIALSPVLCSYQRTWLTLFCFSLSP